MKILHVITSLGDGGAQTQLLRALEDSQICATQYVFSLSKTTTGAAPYLENLRKLQLRRDNVCLLSFSSLFHLLSNKKIDFVVAWLPHAQLFSIILCFVLRSQAKVIFNVRQSLDAPNSFKLSTRIVYYLNKKLSRFVYGFIFNSHYSMNQHRSSGFLLRNSVVIYNKLPKRSLVKTNNRSFIERNRLVVIGYLGRFDKLKNYKLFCRVAVRLLTQNLNVRFVCGGACVSFENEFFRQSIPLHFQRFFDLRDRIFDVAKFFDEIDVFCLCSKAESFPNVLMESLSHGVPCIASRVGDIPLILGGGDWVFEPDNEQQFEVLLSKIVRLGAAQRSKIAEHQVAFVRKNCIDDSFTDEFLNFFGGLGD